MSEAAKAIVGEWLEQFRLPELVVREVEHAELDIQDGHILSFDGREPVEEFPQVPVWKWLLES